MTDKKQIRTLARQLHRLSLNPDGTLSDARAQAILAHISGNPTRNTLPLLRAYKTLLASTISKHTATIEHAGTITPENTTQITTHFAQKYHRPITPKTKQNPALIAGLRIRIADDLYDTSLDSRLTTLLQTLSQ